MLSLKNMQAQAEQQRQLQPLVLQQHQLQLSQAQMQQRQMQQQEADQAGLRQAYVEGGGDPEKIGPLLNKYKVSPDGQARFSQSVTAGRESRAKLNKAEADAQDSMNNIALPRLQAFRSKPKEYQQQNWGAFNRMLHQDHGMNDEHYAQVLKQHPDLPDDDTLDIYEASMKGSKAEMDRRKTAAAITASESANTKNTQAITKADDQKVLGQLRGATSLDQWNKILADNGRSMNDFGPPPFDTQTGEGGTERTPDQGALRRLNRMGMTSAEIAADDRAIAAAAETKRRSAETESNAKARLKLAENRDKRETATQRKDTIMRLADKAIADSFERGGTTLDHVLANVEDTNNYQNSPTGDNRGEVVAELRKRKDAKLNTGAKESKLDDAAAKAKMLKDAGIVDTDVTGGGRGSPIVTPTTAKTPAKKETPKAAPAATAASPQRMRNAAGHVIEYDPKLNAWVDAETRKPVQ